MIVDVSAFNIDVCEGALLSFFVVCTCSYMYCLFMTHHVCIPCIFMKPT